MPLKILAEGRWKR